MLPLTVQNTTEEILMHSANTEIKRTLEPEKNLININFSLLLKQEYQLSLVV